MANEVFWLKSDQVLQVKYEGHQTKQTILACMDEQAAELDKAARPVIVLVDWRHVTGMDSDTLLGSKGHRGYSHPMAAQAILVGLSENQAFQNTVSAFSTRKSQHTQYMNTMEEAMDYLQDVLKDDAGLP